MAETEDIREAHGSDDTGGAGRAALRKLAAAAVTLAMGLGSSAVLAAPAHAQSTKAAATRAAPDRRHHHRRHHRHHHHRHHHRRGPRA